ncbi:spoIIIJ-associated protein [Psychrobacillus insolitus]|uniref:RNA-binding protein KhpB n=1 Tax=Psychrobacillus insolitus TaxID=1461 RepID=A0A2W7MF23_9BACI|nr:RNA-binding cell elongation regulator Jag/EloR [Psychrobacillus insolitus]PZX03742.1 spoIIIJ-associated protein [Psychrobacillus insolitus]
MKQITETAPTKEKAIAVALEKLGVSIQDVSITVLDEGKKGFLGFGVKPAVVQVTVLKNEEDLEEEIVNEPEIEVETEITEIQPSTSKEKEGINDQALLESAKYMNDIAKQMNIDDLSITQKIEGKYVYLHLDSKKAALLIGKRGQTLNALENLTQLVINKYSNSYLMLKLDVGNYRERRKETLEQLAERVADKAVRTGIKQDLEPMSSLERKIIHNALSSRLDIETYSVGTDPNRYLVIESIK